MATQSQTALYLTEDEIELLTQAVESGEMDATQEAITTMYDRLVSTACLAFGNPDEMAAELEGEDFPA